MNDPRYPTALGADEPEFATDKERADYFEALAKEYAAKITAIKWVLGAKWGLEWFGTELVAITRDEPVPAPNANTQEDHRGPPGSIDNPDGFR